MYQHHLRTHINASFQQIRNTIQDLARLEGEMIIQREPQLLVVRFENLYYVYALHPDSTMLDWTTVDLVVTHDAEGARALADAEDLREAFAALQSSTDSHDIVRAQEHLELLRQNVLESTADRLAASENPLSAAVTGAPLVSLAFVWFLFWGFVWCLFLGRVALLDWIFGGLLSATLLLALNWGYMGKPFKAISTAIGVPLVFFISLWLFALLLPGIDSNITVDRDRSDSVMNVMGLVLSIVLTYIQIQRQKPFHKASLGYFGWRPLSGWSYVLWVPVPFAVVAGVLIGFQGVPILWDTIFRPTYAALASYTTYQDERLSLSYPSQWHPHSRRAGQLLLVGNSTIGGTLAVVEEKNVFSIFRNHLDPEALFNTLKAAFPDLEHAEMLRQEIEDRELIRCNFRYTVGQQSMVSSVLFWRDGNDMIYLMLSAPPGMSFTIDRVINSLHFMDSTS